MFDQVLNTPLINYLSVLTLKSLLSFELLPFRLQKTKSVEIVARSVDNK